jgi:hypothetical protein
VNLSKLSGLLQGRIVAGIDLVEDRLELRFTDGSWLAIERTSRGVSVVLHEVVSETASGNRPTRRQREYLDYIRRYMTLHGESPSEADIQTHFMVSAPSAHQMVKTLERRGFIARDRDFFGNVVPRSIRVLID